MKPLICIIILLLLPGSQSATVIDVADEMPIIAYWGIPEQHTSEDAFRLFSECGFTVSIFPYSSLEALVKACRMAEKWGARILGKCPEQTTSYARTAATLKKESGFFGYFIQDEPDLPQIRQRQEDIARIKMIDNIHLFYINLFPYYNPDWIKLSLKTDSYSEYLKAASSTSCQQLSFDFYPVTTKRIRHTWYHNLEMIRRESVRSGKPFWAFVLSTPHNVPYDKNNFYPLPTLASLRLQVYSNLSYGAQAIQYFTYWTPNGSDRFHFHDGPIGLDGKKTKTYNLVQQMNRELKSIARLFYGAKVTAVHHLGGILPQGTTRQTRIPQNLSSLKVVSSKGVIISQLEKNGHQYLAIVNKNHEDSIQVLITPKNNIPKHLTKQLKVESVESSYRVQPGDLLLFRLQ